MLNTSELFFYWILPKQNVAYLFIVACFFKVHLILIFCEQKMITYLLIVVYFIKCNLLYLCRDKEVPTVFASCLVSGMHTCFQRKIAYLLVVTHKIYQYFQRKGLTCSELLSDTSGKRDKGFLVGFKLFHSRKLGTCAKDDTFFSVKFIQHILPNICISFHSHVLYVVLCPI